MVEQVRDRHTQTVQESPDDKRPIGAMPNAGDEKREQQVAPGKQRTAAVSAERDVHVITEPARKTDVPARPELSETHGDIGMIEIEHEGEPHESGDAATH